MIISVSVLLSVIIWGHSSASAVDINQSLTTKIWEALATQSSDHIANKQEKSILGATLALKEDNPQKALKLLSMPEVKGDPLASLLKAEAHRLSALKAMKSAGNYAKHQKVSTQQFASIDLSEDLNEATVRLQAFADKLDGTSGMPVDLLLFNHEIKSVFLVDKARNRLFVYKHNTDGSLTRVADEYVVTGARSGDKKAQGDAKTPNGVYRFTSIRHDPALETKYGPVVFPIDYPNSLDKLHHKTGDGIWMHGYSENVKRRPPQDTRGCFALPNPILKKLEAYISPSKTWVIIGENFLFDKPEQQSKLLTSVQGSIQAWLNDWQSLDTKAYLSHYHPSFRTEKHDLKSWKAYKTRVNKNKTFIRVSQSNITIIHDPTRWKEGEVVVVEFLQGYQSSNFNITGKKRLYLARTDENKPWKILIEENFDD